MASFQVTKDLPYVGRACEGKLFDSINRVVELMRRTSTQTGLRTTVRVIEKIYQIGRIAADAMKATLNILHDAIVPKWNYVAHPKYATN